MIYADVLLKAINFVSFRLMLWGVLVVIAAAGITACGSKDKPAGQTLVRINGRDITVLQLNNELQRVNVPAGKQEAASKELLESMIDRQLLVEEAMLNQVDRTPEVVQDIERAKSQIIAQAYLQSITSKVARPSNAEIDNYFQNHPEFFSKRKEFVLTQLIIPNKNFSEELSSFINSAKTPEEVAEWMQKHGVQYTRREAIRSSTDLPPEVVAKLLDLPKGQLFIVSEGDNRVLNAIEDIKDSPITKINAAPLIEQFLTNEKMKDAAKVELANLRSRAKIEYLNASAPVAVQTQADATGSKTVSPK
ncbi:MAG: EpsD family peptidyl-prolyl cis-trans isomerase [Gallionella sp.]